jgi:hypothetical protein
VSKPRALLVVVVLAAVFVAAVLMRATRDRDGAPARSSVPVELGLVVQPTMLGQSGKVLVLEFAPIDECFPEYDIDHVDVEEQGSRVTLAAWGRAGSSRARERCRQDVWKYETVVLERPLGNRELVDGNCGARGGSRPTTSCVLAVLPADVVRKAMHRERLFAPGPVSVAL